MTKSRRTWSCVLALIASVIVLAIAAAILGRVSKSERTWYLRDGVLLQVTRNDGILSDRELVVNVARNGRRAVRLANFNCASRELVSLDRIRIVQSSSGLIGVLSTPMFISIGPQNAKNVSTTWTAFVLPQSLCAVIDYKTGKTWKFDPSDPESLEDRLRVRFIDEVTSITLENREVLSGIETIDLEATSAKADIIESLRLFPDLDGISISETALSEDAIDAIHSLDAVTKLWLSYITFSDDSLRALGRLDNLVRLTILEDDIARVPNSGVILDQLRKALPNTLVTVLSQRYSNNSN